MIGYRIHYGFTNGTYPVTVEAGASTNITLNLPVPGETYFFVATAYDSLGVESDYSNEVGYTDPRPPPTAVDQSIETSEDEPVALPWGADAGYSLAATWLLAVPPTRGSAAAQNGSPVYSPFRDLSGSDNFVYFVIDGTNAYKINADAIVHPVNDPPFVWDFDVWTDANTPVEVTLPGWDVENDGLSFEIIAQPNHGVLRGDGAAWVYEPDPDFHGLDAFNYLANDGAANSQPAAVWIWVSPLDDRPVALDEEVVTPEDIPVEVTLEGRSPSWYAVTFAVTEAPQHGELLGEGAVLTYVPAANFNGPDQFRYVAQDGVTNSEPATVRIGVMPVNDPPVAQDLDVATAEDTPVAVGLQGFDVDGDALTFAVTEPPQHGVLQGEGAALTYVPAVDFNGPDQFRYVAQDGVTNSAPATVRITVAPVNDPPVARDLDVATAEDSPVAVALQGFDVDGDPLTFEVIEPSQQGVLQGEGAVLTYVPAADFNGSDQFRYIAKDGVTHSEPATVRIVIQPVNDPPLAKSASYRIIEGLGRDLLLEAEDVDGDPLTLRITQSPMHGVLSGYPPQVRYEPGAGFQGSDSFAFLASDGLADSGMALVSLEVLPKSLFEATLSVKVEGERLSLSWNAVAGERYRVWYRRTLAEGDWVQVAEIPPASDPQQPVSVSVPGQEGFYRCELVAY